MTTTTESKNGSGGARKTHNFSLLPSLLLIIQLLLLLLGVFKIEHELIAASNSFFETSLIFLNILHVCLVIWYWIKKPVFKQKDFSRKYKVTNTFICAANIILLNKLYDNSKLNELFEAVKTFFAGKSVISVFLILVVLGAVFIAVYIIRNKPNKYDEKLGLPNLQKESVVSETSEDKRASLLTQKRESEQSVVSNSSRNTVFYIVLIIVALLLIAVICIALSEFDYLRSLLNSGDQKKDLFVIIVLLIAAVFIVPAVVFFIVWVSRAISRFIRQMPEYMNETKGEDARIIKAILGIGSILLIVVISLLRDVRDIEWLRKWLDDKSFLVIPFIIIFILVLSMIFSNIVYGFFWGNWGKTARNRIRNIASESCHRVLDICHSTITGFFRAISFPPDFLESIETVLFGEDNKPKKRGANKASASKFGTNPGGGSISGTNNPGTGNNQNPQNDKP